MEKNKNLIYIVLAFVAGLLLMYLFNNYKIEKKNTSENTEISYQKSETQNQDNSYSYEKKSKKNQDNFEKEKSDFSNKLSNETNSIPFSSLGSLFLSKTKIFILNALAISETLFPIFPNPIMPKVLPFKSNCGVKLKQKLFFSFQIPSLTAW